jgi:hypothetical protein
MKAFALVLISSGVFWSSGAEARPFDDALTYEVTVTDDAGRPLEGATVWTLGDSLTRTDLQASDLARLVSRYGQDVDFVLDDELHPHLEVWRTDASGKLQIEKSQAELGRLKRVRMHFAAFKRGHVPMQISDESREEATRAILFRLVPDAQVKVDERMLELDRLRAKAQQLARTSISFKLATDLKSVASEMRVLAADLEGRGLVDEAAAAYVTLAYLPAVETARDSQGKPMIIGFTNRFKASIPSRAADRERAMKLQRSHPMLAFQVSMSDYVQRGLDPTATGESAVRAEYVKETRAILAQHGDRLWPMSRYYLWQALIREKDFTGACDALREFHRSEPSLFHRERWQRLVTQYRDEVKAAGGPRDARCDLPLAKR